MGEMRRENAKRRQRIRIERVAKYYRSSSSSSSSSGGDHDLGL